MLMAHPAKQERGVGVYIAFEEGTETYYVMRLGFKVTNNKAKYEVVLAGLAIAEASGAKEVEMKAD